MPREKNQKIKIIRISDILCKARGTENAVTTQGLIAMLANDDIPCDRRTLADNIRVLQGYINENMDYDYNICETSTPKGKLYYSEPKDSNSKRSFSADELAHLIKGINSLTLTQELPKETASALKAKIIELAPEADKKILKEYAADDGEYLLDTVSAKMMIDSINSFTFISKKTADKLINLVIRLAEPEDRTELGKDKPLYRKNDGKGISLYEMDTIMRSIREKKKLSFMYFSPDENHEKIYHNDGNIITAEPLHMVQCDDNYYLICYSDRTESHSKTYRFDYMEKIVKSDEGISEEAISEGQKEKNYAFDLFHMFSGPIVTATLSFDDNMIGQIFDRFGKETQITRNENGRCTVTHEISVSPPFWGWLFQYGNAIHIDSPTELADEYRARLSSLLENI